MEATNERRDVVRDSKKVDKIFWRWFNRYLMAIELYMVEPWEKVFIHIVFAIVFGLFWYFNYSIIVNFVSQLRGSLHAQEL